MIAVSEEQLKIVKDILNKYVPNCEVRAFGSRYKWTNKDYSDLDLAIVGDGKMDWKLISDVKEAFQESELPFRVDVLDWHKVSDEFREVIGEGYEVIQDGSMDCGVRCSDWREVKLGDIIEIEMGQSPKSEFYNIDGSGLPFLQGNRTFGEMYPTFDTFSSVIKKVAMPNDVIMSVRAPVGDLNIATEKICIGRGLCAIRMKNANNRYLFYLLKHNIKTLINKESGTVFGSVNKNDIVGLSVKYTENENEQKAIAATLSCLDDKIELNNRMNKTLEEMAQAIFKSWFVDFEPFQDGEFEDSELGRIPKGWRVGTLGDYAKVKSGYAFKSLWWGTEGIPVIKIKDISGETINFNDTAYVTSDKAELATEFKVNGGELLIAMTGATLGKFGIVPKLESSALVNQRVGKFFLGNEPIEKVGFLFCNLKHERIFKEIIENGAGSAQPNISSSNIENIKIIFPTTEVLDRFNTLVKNNFEKITENYAENTKIISLRDTLLPKLMSGEIRV